MKRVARRTVHRMMLTSDDDDTTEIHDCTASLAFMHTEGHTFQQVQ